MMDQQTTAKFEGWAVIELFGHNREAGYVTTQYFGDKAMFQIDVPELPLRDYELKRPQYIGSTFAPVGTKVQKAAKEGRTRIISPGAVYALNPCSKDLCIAALEELAPREIKIVELAKSNQIAAAVEPGRVGSIHEDPDGARCDSCGAEVGTPHSLTCEYEQVPL